MADEICNVFISHIHEDDHRLVPLKELLAKNGCIARDSSVTSNTPNDANDPDYIMREILKPRIDHCGTLIVLVTPDTKDHEWVDREIEYAHQQGKRIVGVWDLGDQGCEVPEKLDEYANAIVPWRAEQIIDAIFERIDEFRDPKGNTIPERNMARYKCT